MDHVAVMRKGVIVEQKGIREQIFETPSPPTPGTARVGIDAGSSAWYSRHFLLLQWIITGTRQNEERYRQMMREELMQAASNYMESCAFWKPGAAGKATQQKVWS
ncbi:MAG: hypothetical protein ACR5LD_02820 [Symbiopectobacterium sp.]